MIAVPKIQSPNLSDLERAIESEVLMLLLRSDEDIAGVFKERAKDVDKAITKHISILEPVVKRALRDTLPLAVKAITITISRGIKKGGVIRDCYATYVRLCRAAGKVPASFRSFERFFQNGRKSSSVESTEKSDKHFNCALTKFACSVLTELMQLACSKRLGDGHLLLAQLEKLGVKRILLLDGSYLVLNKIANALAEKEGEKSDSVKGYVGGSARKIHNLFDVVSCSVVDFAITAGTDSERKVLSKMLDDQVIHRGDLIMADAGYPSKELLAEMNKRHVLYIQKAKKDVNHKVVRFRCYSVSKSDTAGIVELTPTDKASVPANIKTCKNLPSDENCCTDADVLLDNGAYARLVKFPNEDKDDPNDKFVYLYTNIPREQKDPFDICLFYRLRWQVELFFKSAKQHCFLNGYPFKTVGVADFFTLMSLVAYHIKLLMAQVAQEYSGKTLSMLSTGKLNDIDMCCFLGVDIFTVTPIDVSQISKRAIKTRARAENMNRRCELYGPFAFTADIILVKAVKSGISFKRQVLFKSVESLYNGLEKTATTYPLN